VIRKKRNGEAERCSGEPGACWGILCPDPDHLSFCLLDARRSSGSEEIYPVEVGLGGSGEAGVDAKTLWIETWLWYYGDLPQKQLEGGRLLIGIELCFFGPFLTLSLLLVPMHQHSETFDVTDVRNTVG
jgi:hypothetical protein